MGAAETDFQAWMGDVQARMEAALGRLLPAAHTAPARLHEAMRYATLEGGNLNKATKDGKGAEERYRETETKAIAAKARAAK